MTKLKSERNAPLQFISPYTQTQCIDRLEQHFGDTDDMVFFRIIDDTLTQFQINYHEGSTWIIAHGSLKTWAAGEQTHVACQAQYPDAEDDRNYYSGEILSGLGSFTDELGCFWFILALPITGILAILQIYKSSTASERVRINRSKAKVANQLYDRLIALLYVPEYENATENEGAPGENRLQKREDADHYTLPLQFDSLYPQMECIERLQQHFDNTNDRLIYKVVDNTRTKFKIHLEVDSKQYVVIGNLKTWTEGAKTRLNCKVQDLDSNGDPLDASSHADVSSQLYDRLITALSAPEKS